MQTRADDPNHMDVLKPQAIKKGRLLAALSVRCVRRASRIHDRQAITPVTPAIRTRLSPDAVNSLDIGSPPFNC